MNQLRWSTYKRAHKFILQDLQDSAMTMNNAKRHADIERVQECAGLACCVFSRRVHVRVRVHVVWRTHWPSQTILGWRLVGWVQTQLCRWQLSLMPLDFFTSSTDYAFISNLTRCLYTTFCMPPLFFFVCLLSSPLMCDLFSCATRRG